MATLQAPCRRPSTGPLPRRGDAAAVWINGRTARIALLDDAGQVSTCEIARGLEPEPSYLAIVIRAIGDRERVAILGPSSMRLALEREFVAIHHRPERLVDVEPAGALEMPDLVRRVRELGDRVF